MSNYDQNEVRVGPCMSCGVVTGTTAPVCDYCAKKIAKNHHENYKRKVAKNKAALQRLWNDIVTLKPPK